MQKIFLFETETGKIEENVGCRMDFGVLNRKKIEGQGKGVAWETVTQRNDFLSRGLPHQQAANVESTLLKGEKLNKQSP